MKDEISESHQQGFQRNPGYRNASRNRSLSWTLVNFLLDAALFIIFAMLCWVSALTRFVFPNGSTGTDWTFAGRSLDNWRDFQFGVLCAFAVGVLIHVMLHWTWVCGVVESKLLSRVFGKRIAGNDGTRTLVGVILLALTLLGMGIGLAVAAYLMKRTD